MFKVDTDLIKPLPYPTEPHKVKYAYSLGKTHARNHFYCEEPDPDWTYNVKSWTVNPYSEERPSVFYSWIAGFYEEWAELIKKRKPKNERNRN